VTSVDLISLIGVLKKLKDKILTPKNDRALSDHSFRQTNFFGKTTNLFFTYIPRTNKYNIADFEYLPKEVLDIIKKQFEPVEEIKKPKNRIKLIRNDYHDGIKEYKKHYEKSDLFYEIYPFINPRLKSIFKLAIYAKEYYDMGEKEKGDEVRKAIGKQYGDIGRKILNLYCGDYFTNMMKNYIGKIFESTKIDYKIEEKINKLITKAIHNAEYVFFVYNKTNHKTIVWKIKSGIYMDKSYLAVHGSGINNVSIVDKIYQKTHKLAGKRGYKIEYNINSVSFPDGKKYPFIDYIIKKSETEDIFYGI